MGLVENYKWICIKTMTDSKKAYELEQVFYKNKMPFQVRQNESEYAIWIPMKYKDLSIDVVENYLTDNLSDGFVRYKEDEKPEDKIYIGRKYERRAPPKFYFYLFMIAVFLLLLRVTYGFDFL